MDKNRSAKATQVRFGLVFAATAALLLGAYAFPYGPSSPAQAWFKLYLSGYASLVGAVLSLFEPNVHVAGTVIIGRTALEIVKTCDAMEINILFTAAMVAFPGPWGRKLAGLGLGLFGLVAFNVLRITSLYFVAVHYPGWFEVIHLELWPLILVVVAVGAFLLTIMWMAPRTTQPEA